MSILEDSDVILASDWCRPLTLVTMSGGQSDDYSFESEYTGAPENNTKWVPAKEVMPAWIGYTVGEYHERIGNCHSLFEFIRGPIPEAHLYGKTRRQIREEYEDYLVTNIFKVGKYKGKDFRKIRNSDNSYFNWAIDAGLIKEINYHRR